jgi:hypothetical protein
MITPNYLKNYISVFASPMFNPYLQNDDPSSAVCRNKNLKHFIFLISIVNNLICSYHSYFHFYTLKTKRKILEEVERDI